MHWKGFKTTLLHWQPVSSRRKKTNGLQRLFLFAKLGEVLAPKEKKKTNSQSILGTLNMFFEPPFSTSVPGKYGNEIN